MSQLPLSVEINTNDVLSAMVNDLGVGEVVDFVEELLEKFCDQDLNHELYELMRRNHEEIIEDMGITEVEYQTDYAPVEYEGIETDDEDTECWGDEGGKSSCCGRSDCSAADDDEDVMDVFTTD